LSIILASILITFALIFYSVGVWSERIAKNLKPWHVWAFWTGFLFDVCGTMAMHLIAEGSFDILKPHTFTGQVAIWLMLVHAVWATRVAWKGSDKVRLGFHRYSIVIWVIWLVPYVGGMILGMNVSGSR
jgi:uncharacterized repeat protein (TIGR03987 family)